MTDVIVVDEEGRSVIGKAPTSPHDESIGYMESLEEALETMGIDPKRDEFLPDLDTFYRDWLGRPLPDELEYVDKTLDAVRAWSR
jgi:hypothetical protein